MNVMTATTDLFKEAMASFPSGVTIVTTTDRAGRWWGFTATSFCAVSMRPPLVLVCLTESAECHPVFTKASKWAINIIHYGYADVAMLFATRGADKFASDLFAPSDYGIPVLARATAVLECDLYSRLSAGDHTILVGQVRSTRLGDEPPAVYFRRAFHELNDNSTR
jgi:flavin reductase ActVB